MSRTSQNNYIKNPATLNLEWSGSEGHFHYWDKDAKERVKVGAASFAVLDELACVRGWMDSESAKAFSNEVKSTKNEELVVKYFKDGKAKVKIQGFYDDIKGDLLSLGVKFHSVIYVMMLSSGEIVRIYLKGAALGAWIDKGFDAYKDGIEIKGAADGKKGAIKFKMPIFGTVEMTEDEQADADKADKELQEYFKTKDTPVVPVIDVPADTADEYEDDIPF